MKLKIKIALLSSIFITGIITGSFAQTTIKNITAQINTNVRVMLNGNQFTMKDASGKVLSPIIYNGLYYLPAVSIADSAGLSYDFDKMNQAIILGERTGKGVSLFDLKYDTINQSLYITKDPEKLTFNKTTYKVGMYSHSNLGSNIEYTNLNKRFQKLYFKTWIIGKNPVDIKVTADNYSGIELCSKTINSADGIVSVEVPVQGAKGICFRTKTENSNIYIVEAYLK